MKQFLVRLLSKLKRSSFLAAAGLLLVGGLVTGLQLHNKAEAVTASAAVDYFLKIDGIEGESTDKGHEKEIELTSYSWSKDAPGVQQQGNAGGGGGVGKVQLRDIHFTTPVNKSSSKLMQACASGKHIKEAILTARKAGGSQQDFIVIKMNDVVVSSYRSAGQDGGVPVDEFSLSFAKVEFSYASQKADGSHDAPVVDTWDFKENN